MDHVAFARLMEQLLLEAQPLEETERFRLLDKFLLSMDCIDVAQFKISESALLRELLVQGRLGACIF